MNSQYKFILIILLICNTAFANNKLLDLKFNGDINDYSSYNLKTKLNGNFTPTIDRFGNSCGAMWFDGTSNYIEVETNKKINKTTKAITICFWYKLPQNQTTKWLSIVCKGNGKTETPNNPQFRLQAMQNKTQSTISLNTEFTEFDKNYNQHPFTEESWTFYCLSYRKGKIKVYQNSALIMEFPYKNKLKGNDLNLYIGRDEPGSDEFYKGGLDDLKIFNETLTENEIKQIQNETPTLHENPVSFNIPIIQNQIYYANNYKCGVNVKFETPKIDVFCGAPLIEQVKGPKTGDFAAVGNYNMVFRANDLISNSIQTISYNIAILDTTPPHIHCMNDTIIIIEQEDTSIGKNINIEIPKADDNCKVKSVEIVGQKPGNNYFSLGTNRVRFEATDIHSNTSYCESKIIISKELNSAKTDTSKIGKLYFEHNEIELVAGNYFLAIYDNEIEDGDSISIYLNDDVLIEKQMLKMKKNGIIYKEIALSAETQNTLVSKAWNKGKIGLNTLELDIYLNDPRLNNTKPIKSFIMNSKPGLSSALKINCK